MIHTQPSTTATAGQAFAIEPVIYLEDSSGNIETTDNSTMVTVSLASGSGTLQGTKTVSVVDGVATFAGLSDTKAETISLKFSTTSLTGGPSTNITVSPAAPYQLLIHTQPSSSATAGQAFATQPQIFEVDQYGNLETTDNFTAITAALASGNGPLQGTSISTVSGGVATFAGLADNRAGTISLNFSGAGLSAGPTNNVFITPAAAAALVIQTPPYTQVTAGNPLTDPIVINEVDQYGNIETTDNSTVVTVSQTSGGGSLTGTMTAKVVAGVASFNDVENDTAGQLTLQFAAPSLPPVISAPSTVVAAPATHLVISQPTGAITAGVPFGLTLEAEDQFGNVDTNFNGSIAVALGNGSNGSLSGTTSMMASAGVATFANLVDSASGPISLNVTGGTLTGTSSGARSPSAPLRPPNWSSRCSRRNRQRRRALLNSARSLRRRPVWQPLDRRQHHSGDRLLGQRCRFARRHVKRDRLRRNRPLHRSRRTNCREHFTLVHRRRLDRDSECPDHHQPGRRQQSGDPDRAIGRGNRRTAICNPVPCRARKYRDRQRRDERQQQLGDRFASRPAPVPCSEPRPSPSKTASQPLPASPTIRPRPSRSISPTAA